MGAHRTKGDAAPRNDFAGMSARLQLEGSASGEVGLTPPASESFGWKAAIKKTAPAQPSGFTDVAAAVLADHKAKIQSQVAARRVLVSRPKKGGLPGQVRRAVGVEGSGRGVGMEGLRLRCWGQATLQSRQALDAPVDRALWQEELVTTDDTLANLLNDKDLCLAVNLPPGDVLGATQFYEALAINFLHDQGILQEQVRRGLGIVDEPRRPDDSTHALPRAQVDTDPKFASVVASRAFTSEQVLQDLMELRWLRALESNTSPATDQVSEHKDVKWAIKWLRGALHARMREIEATLEAQQSAMTYDSAAARPREVRQALTLTQLRRLSVHQVDSWTGQNDKLHCEAAKVKALGCDVYWAARRAAQQRKQAAIIEAARCKEAARVASALLPAENARREQEAKIARQAAEHAQRDQAAQAAEQARRDEAARLATELRAAEVARHEREFDAQLALQAAEIALQAAAEVAADEDRRSRRERDAAEAAQRKVAAQQLQAERLAAIALAQEGEVMLAAQGQRFSDCAAGPIAQASAEPTLRRTVTREPRARVVPDLLQSPSLPGVRDNGAIKRATSAASAVDTAHAARAQAAPAIREQERLKRKAAERSAAEAAESARAVAAARVAAATSASRVAAAEAEGRFAAEVRTVRTNHAPVDHADAIRAAAATHVTRTALVLGGTDAAEATRKTLLACVRRPSVEALAVDAVRVKRRGLPAAQMVRLPDHTAVSDRQVRKGGRQAWDKKLGGRGQGLQDEKQNPTALLRVR